MSTLRIGSRCFAAVAILLVTAAVVATAATAAGVPVLDPQLSLIGGCLEEKLDPVEDPGCPTEHAPTLFDLPRDVTTDQYGTIYVDNWGKKDLENGSESYIDIFDSEGRYISEIPKGVVQGAFSVAVDSIGTLYVWSYYNGGEINKESGTYEGELLRFEPCAP